MLHYFAYGSNMLRARLEARVGVVLVVGPALLDGYAHGFTKLGQDGTGKGNIALAPGTVVHGVLYRLELVQMTLLRQFEGGYRQIALSVRCGERAVTALSFTAIRPVPPLAPTCEYLDYYDRGMREHGLPPDYRALVLAQAQVVRPRAATRP